MICKFTYGLHADITDIRLHDVGACMKFHNNSKMGLEVAEMERGHDVQTDRHEHYNCHKKTLISAMRRAIDVCRRLSETSSNLKAKAARFQKMPALRDCTASNLSGQ
jgi:hypothetical protein